MEKIKKEKQKAASVGGAVVTDTENRLQTTHSSANIDELENVEYEDESKEVVKRSTKYDDFDADSLTFSDISPNRKKGVLILPSDWGYVPPTFEAKNDAINE